MNHPELSFAGGCHCASGYMPIRLIQTVFKETQIIILLFNRLIGPLLRSQPGERPLNIIYRWDSW